MAFGLGYDKAKILQAAEKYVIQGKIPAAIEEYQKIIKKDPKDLMTLNAIGDLYMRINKNDEALSIFHQLAEKAVEAGMVPRAIAVYKRITKLDPESLSALEKLGELYSMQGLMRDSRTYYQMAVDIHVKRGDKEKARSVFERVLMLDMDNPKLLKRMGDLYVETKRDSEAVSTYLSAAERFLDGNEPEQALAVLGDIRKLDPTNSEAGILQGRALLDQGKPAEAISAIESLPEFQQNKSALSILFHAHLKQGDLAKAEETANQMLDIHEDVSGLDLLAAGLLDRGDDEGALAVYQRVAARLEGRGGLAPIGDGLRRILDRDSKNKAALELLWTVCKQTADAEQGRQVGERLANLALEEGEPMRAREIYSELCAAEPENYELSQQLRRIDARYVSAHPKAESVGAESAPLMAMDTAAESGEESSHVGSLPPREQALVKNCITECELYITYHQTAKAIETLEKGLLEVPGDIALNEHLLPLYEQAQEYGKALRTAEALTEAYVKMGDGERASRYGELLLGYQTKLHEAGAAADALAMPVSGEEAPAEVPAAEPVAAEDSQVREVDLSMEWNSISSEPATTSSSDSTVEEIEFYLQAGLPAEAEESLNKLRGLDPSHASLADFQKRLDIMLGRGASVAEVTMPEWGGGSSETAEALPAEIPAELATDQPVFAQMTEPESSAFLVPEPVAPAPLFAEPEPAVAEAPPIPEPVWEPAPVAELEPVSEPVVAPAPVLASEPSPAEVEMPAWATAASVAAPAPVSAPAEAELDLENLAPSSRAAGGFELALDDHAPAALPSRPVPPPAAPPAPSVAAAAAAKPAASGGGMLDDLFAEFRDEVETPQPGGDGDLETHYNMGVAFKEMALYDEAIGEFQRVHQLAEAAKDYSHVVQCCSLLALCFIEKGMPQLAVNWYQTALKSPGVDAESSMALLYEMGNAYEMAGDRQAALKSFMDVYARNIDYRGVAERIRELQQGS